jgi:hypothetical protein
MLTPAIILNERLAEPLRQPLTDQAAGVPPPGAAGTIKRTGRVG